MDSFKWIKVDRNELNQNPREEEIAGVLVDVYFSPYDMPDKIGGSYNESKKCFVIKFDYASPHERLFEKSVDDHMKLQLGENSKRIYEVDLDVDKLGVSEVRLNIDEVEAAIKKFTSRMSSENSPMIPIDNYIAASGALAQNRNRLAEKLSLVE